MNYIAHEANKAALDVRDDPETATPLFDLVDAIREDQNAHPNKVKAMYLKLPEGARKQIEGRNAKLTKAP